MTKLTVILTCRNCLKSKTTEFGREGYMCKLNGFLISDYSHICKHHKISKQDLQIWIDRAAVKVAKGVKG
jgi:hypothetical protein